MASKGMYIIAAVILIVLVGSVGIWLFYSQGIEHKLVITHPHSAALADKVINNFKDWVQETQGYSITVSQLTPGGSGAVLEQVWAWEGNPEADIYWGGGSYNFEEAANLHSWAPTPTGSSLLYPYKTANDDGIVETFNGWAMKEYNEDEDPDNPVFYAAALSGFGFMWNTEYLAANSLDTPDTYEDLLDAQYAGHIVMCNPKTSGSTTSSVLGVMQYLTQVDSWTSALSYWAELTGNIGLYVTSSEDVPVKVIAGEYGIGICIDYYAYDPLREGDPVGFLHWPTTVSPDPAAILVGATNMDEAKLFMDYITSSRGQTTISYYRLPTREDVTTTSPVPNPFDSEQFPTLVPNYDVDLHNDLYSQIRQVYNDWLVTNHGAAKDAYSLIKQAESEGETGTNYQNAVAAYTAVPDNVNTAEKLIAIEYKESSIQQGWENFGATQFQEAKNEAEQALAS